MTRRVSGNRGVPVQTYLQPADYARLEKLCEQTGRPVVTEVEHAILRHLASPPVLSVPDLGEAQAPAPKKRGRPRKD